MEQYAEIWHNPVACREEGKRLFFDRELSLEERSTGIKLIDRASRLGDGEALFLMGRFLMEGRLHVTVGDSFDAGMAKVCYAANRGYAPARGYLDRFCAARYRGLVKSRLPAAKVGPLTDFTGKRIKIRRSGLLTPIDARLEYLNGQNVLTLSTNITFLLEEEVSNPSAFRRAVLEGIRSWQGEYEVFGSQKLTVRLELTADDRMLDTVYVIPMTGDVSRRAVEVWDKIGIDPIKERVHEVVNSKRSFAGIGLKNWSVSSRKVIVLQSRDGRFDDYGEILHVAKHEFGHALGLGDLYKSDSDGLPGVEKGTYREIDSYYIDDNLYNLVMCDHHGPISNNDIEMVVLAFRRNRMQHYQPSKRFKGEISEALGKGN